MNDTVGGDPQCVQTLPPAPSSRVVLHQINLVRVIAMVGILLHHFPFPQGLGEGPMAEYIRKLFATAGLGVMIFNLITGFVLALPYLRPGRLTQLPYMGFLTWGSLSIGSCGFTRIIALP